MLVTKIVKMFRKLAGWLDPDAACDACAVPDPAGAVRRPDGPLSEDVSVSVRPATFSDLAAVRRLLIASSLPTRGVEAQFGEQYAVAVAEGSDGLIGVAGYEIHGRYGLFRSAAVDPAWRGRGVGAALTRDRIAAAADRSLAALYALTTGAGGYFSRFGFRRIDRDAVPAPVRASSEFDELCPSSASVLRLDFDSVTAA